MRAQTLRRSAMAALLGLAVSNAGAAAADRPFDPAGWAWRWPLTIESGDGGFARLPLTGEIVDVAALDQRDIRIAEEGGPLTAHLLQQPGQAAPRVVERSARLINRSYVAGEFERVVLDFGSSVEKDHIEAKLSGRDYRRRAVVEGSADGVDWATLADDALLFHVSAPGESFVVDTISLPRNIYRYLRLTVYAMPGEETRFSIEGASSALRRPGVAPALYDAPAASQRVVTDGMANVTTAEIDLSYRNLPIALIQVDAEDRYFYRPYELLGRNEEVVVQWRRTETGEREVEVPAPWRSLGRGVLYRMEDEDGVLREALAISATRAPYRYLKLRIHNGDDAPLTLGDVSVKRHAFSQVVFEYDPEKEYVLYAGNPVAGAPRFDLARAAGPSLQAARLPEAAAGIPVRIAPVEPLRPWTERHRAITWPALAIAVGALFVAVFRALANLPPEQPEAGG